MVDQKQLCHYIYDPLDRLAARTPLAQAMVRRFYNGTQLATEIQDAEQRTFFQANHHLLAQKNRVENEISSALLATDQQRTVLNSLTPEQRSSTAYSPYGHRQGIASLPGLPGFNGEQPDPVTGHYLLGNGYRAYNPVLMRFNSPDSLSPFGIGGLNPYAYCAGDPINRSDPTGHFPWQGLAGFGLSGVGFSGSFGARSSLAIAGLVTGAASVVAGVGQVTTGSFNPKLSSVLGGVSLGLGVGSAGFGAAAGFQKVAGQMHKKLHRPFSSDGRRNIFSPPSTSPAPAPALSIQEAAVRDVTRNTRGNQLINFMNLNESFKKSVPRYLRTSAVSGHADMLSADSIHRLRRIALGEEPGYLPSQVLNYANLKSMTQELPTHGVYEVERQRLMEYFNKLRKLGRT